jgi:hypothetical protein
MCPGCIGALAMLIVGVSSTGGVAALLASKFRVETEGAAKEPSGDLNQNTFAAGQPQANQVCE